MRQLYVGCLVALLAACGSNTGAAGGDAAATGETADDSAAQDADGGADAQADVAVTETISDTVADVAQCLPFLAACKPSDKCCAPYLCMNLGTGDKCQTEGPDGFVQDIQDIQMTDTPVPDVQSQDIAQPDVGVDVTTSDIKVNCSGSAAYAFPDFQATSKACSKDGDCFVAVHQINCCGTHVAFGLNTSAKALFDQAETTCDGQYPGCGCPAFQTQAEDGYSAFDPTTFTATCDSGLCRSHVAGAKPDCTAQGLQSPKPYKGCTTAAECDFSMQTIDCCGSQIFVGIATFAKKDYDAVQQKCASGMAICDCMPKPSTLEDGQTLATNAVPLACVNGACMTGKW